ncbi:MAG: hypothetical protein LJF30_19805 [Acidobacteria bacterium]|jgi:hypothetical protein|nr:hypothetical protein [Acidobacteriota bacterium]
MARGFDSKSVADQQEQAAAPGPTEAPDDVDPATLARRRRLELSRADVERRLATAHAEGHKEILRRALSALDEEIASLG